MKAIMGSFILGCLLVIVSAVFSHYGLLEVAALTLGTGGSMIAWAVLERVSGRRFHENLLMMGMFLIFVPLTLTLKAGASAWVTGVFFALGIVLAITSFFRRETPKDKVRA